MHVWMYENDLNKEIAGVGSVTLMTRVAGFEGLQSEMSDRDPCSSFMMESAWPTWGVPLLLTCPSVCLSEPFDRLKKPDGLSWRRSRFGFFFLGPAWGCREPPMCGGAFVLVLGVR